MLWYVEPSRTQLLSGEIQACVRIPTLIDPCHVYHDHNDDILYYHVIRLYMYICGKSYYTICIHDIVIEITSIDYSINSIDYSSYCIYTYPMVFWLNFSCFVLFDREINHISSNIILLYIQQAPESV